MESKLLNIIKNSDLLSQKEIVAYSKQEGLSKEELYAIELKILSNPDNQELLDTYSEKPDLFEKQNPIKSPLDNYSIEWLLVFTSIILISIPSIYLLKKEKPELISNPIQNIEIVEQEPIENYKKIPTTDLANSSVDEIISDVSSDKKSIPEREMMTIERLVSSKNVKLESEELKAEVLRYKNKYPAVFLGDFKATDYSKIRTYQKDEALDLGGIPASVENQDHTSSFEKLKVDSVFYMAFLRDLLRGFGNKKYSLIITKLDEILQVYPEDDNALFYRGVSLYYLADHQKSVVTLQAVLSDPMSNFTQEAYWHLALNYVEQKEIAKAKELLQEIAQDNAFYAERAKALLKSINE